MKPRFRLTKLYAPPPSNLQQRLFAVLVGLVLAAEPTTTDAQTKEEIGEWSSIKGFHGTAVHFMLMPADTADFHSQLLWWRGRHVHGDHLDGGLHFWKPGADSPSDPWSTSFTSSRPIAIPGVDVFCSSHDQLADGRIFVAGGTEPEGGETGTAEARIFNPFTRSWETPYPSAMGSRRWYPTVTTLWDGRMHVSSGSSHFNFFLHGGIRSGESVPVDRGVNRYQITASGGLDPAVARESNLGSEWPFPIEGHSASDLRLESQMVWFGGRNANSTMSDTTWTFSRTESDAAGDYQYQFTRETGSTPPSARSQHAAVVMDEKSLLVWGGREANGVTTDNDIWIFERISGNLGWRKIQIADNVGPAPRYGHGAVFDPAFNRILIFGGATTLGGAPNDSSVWAFTFANSSRQSGTWSQPTVADRFGDGGPPPLADLGMVSDPVRRLWVCNDNQSGYDWNGILFGGRRMNGSSSNELWILWSRSTGADSGKVDWQKITASGGPSARTRPGGGVRLLHGPLLRHGRRFRRHTGTHRVSHDGSQRDPPRGHSLR